MSETIIQNRWDNGEAEDVRTTSQFQADTVQNFDIFTEPHRLNPLPDSKADLYLGSSMDDVRITDVVDGYADGANHVVGIGFTTGGTHLGFFIKSGTIESNWSLQASTVANNFVRGTGVTYKRQAYAIDTDGTTGFRLIRFTAAGNAENLGAITSNVSAAVDTQTCKTFVHPEDNILYIVTGNVISKWDGATLTNYTSILPSKFDVASLTNYGTYLAIIMNPAYEQKAVCYLWGRDGTLNTLQGTIDLGQGRVAVGENLDDNLFFVMSPNTSNGGDFENKIIIKQYIGGVAEQVAELFSNLTSLNGTVLTYKAKKNNKLYFVMASGYCVYKFGKNKQNIYTLTEDRFIINGALSSTTIGLSIVQNVMWVGTLDISNVFTLQRTRVSLDSGGVTYTSTSVYKTTVNPNMPLADRYEEKQLEAVQLSCTGSASGTYVLKYSIDGSTLTTVISESTTSVINYSKAAGNENDGTPFLSGREIVFQIETTGNVKPVELKYKYSKLVSPL
jgi:hypothetical protein